MTLTELAHRVDVTQANLSKLKNNRAKAVRFSTLTAICRELRCQPGDLFKCRNRASRGRLDTFAYRHDRGFTLRGRSGRVVVRGGAGEVG